VAAPEQPLDHALAVMHTICDADRALSITEVAQLCCLPVPTVHRIAAQLERRSMLKRAFGTRKLLVGPALVRLGASALRASLQSDRVHALLEALANELGEHCQLGMRVGNEVVYADTVRAVRSAGLHFEQGKRAPLYCTSIGKLFLAKMAPDELTPWLKTHQREPLTARTLVSERAIKAAVKAVQQTGWATSNEEMAVGVVGCAVPVRLTDGQLIAGLGISVPSPRVPFDELAKFRAAMSRAAASIADAIEAT
jgi:IclR family transcriptional regulator, acetate operon repressor